MNKKRVVAVIIILLFVTIGKISQQAYGMVISKYILKENPNFCETSHYSHAKSILETMSLEQKVGQLFFVALRDKGYGKGLTKVNEEVKAFIKKYQVGGVVLFRENITDIEQVTAYVEDLQSILEIPLFIGIDEEGGRVTRTNKLDVPRIPKAHEIADTKDYSMAFNAAETIANYLKPLGINVNFAPVADIFTNPVNTVIGDRAFGSDAETAGEMVSFFIKGLQANGVAAAVKHFPGHGDTSEDSHAGMAVTNRTMEQLRERELIPFQMGINENVTFVMVGHISTPEITGNKEPAGFSKMLINDVLRDDMGFSGIVITDALDMGAITKLYSVKETAVKAISSGIDMLLMPEDVGAAYEAIIQAVMQSGELTEERIDESVVRILEAKISQGLNR